MNPRMTTVLLALLIVLLNTLYPSPADLFRGSMFLQISVL